MRILDANLSYIKPPPNYGNSDPGLKKARADARRRLRNETSETIWFLIAIVAIICMTQRWSSDTGEPV